MSHTVGDSDVTILLEFDQRHFFNLFTRYYTITFIRLPGFVNLTKVTGKG